MLRLLLQKHGDVIKDLPAGLRLYIQHLMPGKAVKVKSTLLQQNDVKCSEKRVNTN